jgi:hypothetical protein
MAGEAKAAGKTLGDLLELDVDPMAIGAVVGARHVLVVGTNDELAGAALGTDELAIALKVAYEADMGASKVMDQLIIGRVGRAAPGAGCPKGRQAMTLGAELHAILQHPAQGADFRPLVEYLIRHAQGKLHLLEVKHGLQVVRTEDLLGEAAEETADPDSTRSLWPRVQDVHGRTAESAVGTAEQQNDRTGREVRFGAQFQANSFAGEIDTHPAHIIVPVRGAVRQDGNRDHWMAHRLPWFTPLLAGYGNTVLGGDVAAEIASCVVFGGRNPVLAPGANRVQLDAANCVMAETANRVMAETANRVGLTRLFAVGLGLVGVRPFLLKKLFQALRSTS